MNWDSRYFIVLLSVVLAGCGSPGDKSHLSKISAPLSYSASVGSTNNPLDNWIEDFADPQLNALIAEAQEKNLNLQASAARVMAALGTARIENAGRLPSVDAGFNAARNKRVAAAGFALRNPKADTFGLNATFAWELDLWGKLANRSGAARADAEAAGADFVAAQLSIAANTAKLWFALIEAEMQLRLATQAHDSFQKNLEIVEQGFDRGVREALDVRLTRANVASALASIKARKRERDNAARAMEVILGRYPADQISTRTNLPAFHREIPGGLPSQLLERRPDLMAAERRLAAADARKKLAKKSLYPTISLTANGGTSSAVMEDILDPEQNVWRLAAGLTQPIFRGGTLRGGLEVADARLNEQIAVFSQTVLNAFQEVENSLDNEQLLLEQESALKTAATESVAAEEIAWERYNRGLVDIITVLDSQRRAVNAQSSRFAISRARLQNRVDLYLALGGDFCNPSEATGSADNSENTE
ncbi:MAG: efflux transporter outer membrane subunit [Limisphaerales bacterium]